MKVELAKGWIKLFDKDLKNSKSYLPQDLDVVIINDETLRITSPKHGELSFQHKIADIDCPGNGVEGKIEWLGQNLVNGGKAAEAKAPVLGKQDTENSTSIVLADGHPNVPVTDTETQAAVAATRAAVTEKQTEQTALLAEIKTVLAGELNTGTDTANTAAVVAVTAAVVAGDTANRAKQDGQTAVLNGISAKLDTVQTKAQCREVEGYLQKTVNEGEPTLVADENGDRKDMYLLNLSDVETIWVTFGGKPNAQGGEAGYGNAHRLLPLEAYKPNLSCPTTPIYAQVESGTANLTFVQFA